MAFSNLTHRIQRSQSVQILLHDPVLGGGIRKPKFDDHLQKDFLNLYYLVLHQVLIKVSDLTVPCYKQIRVPEIPLTTI